MATKRPPLNSLQQLQTRAAAGFDDIMADLLAEIGELSVFDAGANAALRVKDAMSAADYEARVRNIIATAAVASADAGLGDFALASVDRYIKWRMNETYSGVTLSQTLRDNAAQTSEILTDTIRAQLKNGTTWTQLARKIAQHDRVSDVAETIADLAKASKKMGVNVDSLARQTQRYVSKMAPNDAPTGYLKRAYQNLIDTVEAKAGPAAVEEALKRALKSKVKYNAERISRTEIARSYNEAFNARIADNPEVTGYKWLLSSRHVIEDECTMLAELDNGQGPGVYRKDDFPAIPVHPNCMCMKVEHYGDAPPLTQYRNVIEYLKGQPLERRASFIGKRNAQHLALFGRGLEQRGIRLGGQGTPPKRVPKDLMMPAPAPVAELSAEQIRKLNAPGILMESEKALKQGIVDFGKHAELMQEPYKNVYKHYAATTKVVENPLTATPIGYDPSKDAIVYNKRALKIPRDILRANWAYSHELAHRYDVLAVKSWENKAFTDAIGAAEAKVKGNLKYYQDLVASQKNLHPAVQDMLSAVSDGHIKGVMGHRWDGMKSRALELFANASYVQANHIAIPAFDGLFDDVFRVSKSMFTENAAKIITGEVLTSGAGGSILSELKLVKDERDKILDGTYKDRVMQGKQRKHIPGTKEFEQNRQAMQRRSPGSEPSILTADAEELFRKYRGKGVIKIIVADVHVQETIDTGEVVGRTWVKSLHKYVDTKRIKIVYTREGVHVIPINDYRSI